MQSQYHKYITIRICGMHGFMHIRDGRKNEIWNPQFLRVDWGATDNCKQLFYLRFWIKVFLVTLHQLFDSVFH